MTHFPSAIDARYTPIRSEEHTSELQSLAYVVCRLRLEKKKRERRVRRRGPVLREARAPGARAKVDRAAAADSDEPGRVHRFRRAVRRRDILDRGGLRRP